MATAATPGRIVEETTSLAPQLVSMLASMTAGLSSIVAAQLTKRFPLSFQSSTPRWKYTIVPLICYIMMYIGLIVYGVLRRGRLSASLALMAAPSIPVHGFLLALIPQIRHPPDGPSTENYMLQVFRRKPRIAIAIAFIPFIGVPIAAGFSREWQGLAVQIATIIAFLATAMTPEMPLRAREDAFGRAGRYLLIPRPGRRDDTVAYGVDLRQETLLEPVRMDITGVEPYRLVSEQKFGRLGRETDDATTSEVPVATYLDSFVTRFPVDRIGVMTLQLWRTLEAWKVRVEIPAKELPLLYGLVERMSYVAYRPGSCTLDERGVCTRLNFINCRADCERSGDSPLREPAVALMATWRELGIELVRSNSWAEAHAQDNLVDNPVPEPNQLMARLEANDFEARDIVETMGATVSFVQLVFGHSQQIVDDILQHLPRYHQRIRSDLTVQGSIPVVCHGVMFSMKKRAFLTGDVYSHSWASQNGEPLRWGGGGYALLDQAYARNSGLAYVGQLAVIVVKAVLDE